MLFGIDVDKAYDSITWDYLLEVLDKLGFGVGYGRLVSMIFQNASVVLCLNGGCGKLQSSQIR